MAFDPDVPCEWIPKAEIEALRDEFQYWKRKALTPIVRLHIPDGSLGFMEVRCIDCEAELTRLRNRNPLEYEPPPLHIYEFKEQPNDQ